MPERGKAQAPGTPLVRKLGIRPQTTVVLLAAPPGFVELLGPLPDGVVLGNRVQGPLDLAVLFATRRVALLRRFDETAEALAPDGGLWVAWPKKASPVRVPTDLDFRSVQQVGIEAGLVDNKICAIDAVWTAVRFVVRLADRPARAAKAAKAAGSTST